MSAIEDLERRVLRSASLSSAVLTVGGTSGDDRISVATNAGKVVVLVNSHRDEFDAGTVGSLVIDGRRGNDEILVTANLRSKIYGGSGDDGITAGPADDRIYAGDGNDNVNGLGGRDIIYGEAGDDSVRGGGGSDLLDGGAGNDTLRGDMGNDNLSGGDGFDRLRGSAGNDSLAGGANKDIIGGENGNDYLAGDGGADLLAGGENDDVLFGGAGDDFESGNDGADFLAGDSGFDQLFGGGGNDGFHLGDDPVEAKDVSSEDMEDATGGGAVMGTVRVINSAGLTKAGAGTLVLSGTNTYTGSTTITGGKLDLTDNKLIINGSGITTSQTDAAGGFGIVTVGSAAGETSVFAGQTVNADDVLVMYTYAGDANLDGTINADDYFQIDQGLGLGSSGWYNGDFNYDGAINADDYSVIDFNVANAGVTAVG